MGLNTKHRARKGGREGAVITQEGNLTRTRGETRQRYQSETGNTPKQDKETDRHTDMNRDG